MIENDEYDKDGNEIPLPRLTPVPDKIKGVTQYDPEIPWVKAEDNSDVPYDGWEPSPEPVVVTLVANREPRETRQWRALQAPLAANVVQMILGRQETRTRVLLRVRGPALAEVFLGDSQDMATAFNGYTLATEDNALELHNGQEIFALTTVADVRVDVLVEYDLDK